jgi:hypothetical protein
MVQTRRPKPCLFPTHLPPISLADIRVARVAATEAAAAVAEGSLVLWQSCEAVGGACLPHLLLRGRPAPPQPSLPGGPSTAPPHPFPSLPRHQVSPPHPQTLFSPSMRPPAHQRPIQRAYLSSAQCFPKRN